MYEYFDVCIAQWRAPGLAQEVSVQIRPQMSMYGLEARIMVLKGITMRPRSCSERTDYGHLSVDASQAAHRRGVAAIGCHYDW